MTRRRWTFPRFAVGLLHCEPVVRAWERGAAVHAEIFDVLQRVNVHWESDRRRGCGGQRECARC